MSKSDEIPKENGNDIAIMRKGDYTIHVLIEEVQGIEQKIVDKVKIYIAPKIIGGETSKTPIEGIGIKNLKDAFKINNLSVSTIGEDILIEGYVEKGDEA